MSKPKYKKGAMITSLDELVKQSVFWQQFGKHHKIMVKGWFLSYQLSYISEQIIGKKIYYADPIDGGNDE